MTYCYRKRFMETIADGGRAKAEGWAEKLRQYVDEAAWVQAQYLCGRRTWATPPRCLFGRGARPQTAGSVLRSFFERAARSGGEGLHFRVSVPPSMAENWKREIAGLRVTAGDV